LAEAGLDSSATHGCLRFYADLVVGGLARQHGIHRCGSDCEWSARGWAIDWVCIGGAHQRFAGLVSELVM
jgi:hypothetical protein